VRASSLQRTDVQGNHHLTAAAFRPFRTEGEPPGSPFLLGSVPYAGGNHRGVLLLGSVPYWGRFRTEGGTTGASPSISPA
jgi:hypothetical protein